MIIMIITPQFENDDAGKRLIQFRMKYECNCKAKRSAWQCHNLPVYRRI